MDGTLPKDTLPLPGGRLRPDWQWLAILFVLVISLRAWLLVNTEVAARDSVGYIRYALRFDELSWGPAIRTFQQHPGYPLAIWLTSLPARAWAGEMTPELMQLCTQLVSGLAAVLLILPTYYLGKALWDARVGFGGALLFQFLPTSGRHLSDGLSEALFLLFVATALLAAVRGLQAHSGRWLLVAGAMTGLAYLTRPEGILILGAVGCVLLAGQFRAASRQPWSRCLGQFACLLLGAAPLIALFVLPTGAFSVKPSIRQMIETAQAIQGPPGARGPGLSAQLWAVTFIDTQELVRRLGLGVWAILNETSTAVLYFGVLPIVIASIVHGRRLVRDAASQAVLVYLTMHVGCLVVLAISSGYVSDRHLMPVIMFLSYFIMVGMLEMVRWAAAWRTRNGAVVAARTVGLVSLSLLAGYVALSLPQTLKRLHANRAGNHEAGRWLAKQVQPGDVVHDDHSWSHFYAGQLFREGKDNMPSAGHEPMAYVVITRSNDPRIKEIRNGWEKRLRFEEKGAIVYHWPSARRVEEARIVIYAVPRVPAAASPAVATR